jgi:monoamine oxidase
MRRVISYAYLLDQYITHHVYDWYHDPYTTGAFALFGPGQFSNLYTYLTRPAADGKLHFVGEASSAHHAWLVGALESAERAVMYALLRFGMRDGRKKCKRDGGRWV